MPVPDRRRGPAEALTVRSSWRSCGRALPFCFSAPLGLERQDNRPVGLPEPVQRALLGRGARAGPADRAEGAGAMTLRFLHGDPVEIDLS